VREPLMLGHYTSTRLSGAEWVVDKLIGGTMQESLRLGQYPDRTGTHQLFANTGRNANPLQPPRPASVLVVGLGEEGKLEACDIAKTVKLGVLALAQRMMESESGPPAGFELAAVLLGSGGSDVSAAKSAQFVAQGVRAADMALAELARATPGGTSRWPRVASLKLIELYLNRASEAWDALALLARSSPQNFQLAPAIRSAPGALQRPLERGYRGSDYGFVRAISSQGSHGESTIEYTVHTQRARSEIRAQSAQLPLVQALVQSAANDRNRDERFGRTLFRLLVPVELEPLLGESDEMLLELDQGTAGIPWEVLDTPTGSSGGDSQPWAIRAKLLRKLRLADFRSTVRDARTDGDILIIGEPRCDARYYPPLPGARREAEAVTRLFNEVPAGSLGHVVSLVGTGADEDRQTEALPILNALLDPDRDWRIIHVAGHGEPPCDKPDANRRAHRGGVVLSNDAFLGPTEVGQLRDVPELVFVNCCHLAARPIGQLLDIGRAGMQDPARFASGIAEALIRLGVKCVIAAGWAVDDDPAECFASAFYRAILRGARFMDAVAEARSEARARGGNTWAAYQCYGDPDWVFRRAGPTPNAARRRPPTSSPTSPRPRRWSSPSGPWRSRAASRAPTANARPPGSATCSPASRAASDDRVMWPKPSPRPGMPPASVTRRSAGTAAHSRPSTDGRPCAPASSSAICWCGRPGRRSNWRTGRTVPCPSSAPGTADAARTASPNRPCGPRSARSTTPSLPPTAPSTRA